MLPISTTPSLQPLRLHLLPVETTTVPLGGSLYGMVVCYLIQMSDGTNILVDSGIPADYQPPAGAPPHTHEHNVVSRLAELGLRPEDIDLFICTHFDVDHAGYHDAFLSAKLIVQRTHYDVARSGHPRYAAARAHWDHPALRYQLVEGDTEIAPGVTLLETSGHAPGHQSVLVRLPRTGAVLLAADAVVLARLFTPERRAGRSTTTRSSCAPARASCSIWRRASRWRWSSSAMTPSNGGRSGRLRTTTSE